MKMRSILVMFLVLGLLAGPICSAAYAACQVYGQVFRVSTFATGTSFVYVRPYWQVQPTYNYQFTIGDGKYDVLDAALAAQNAGCLVNINGDVATCPTGDGQRNLGEVIWLVPLH